LALDPNLLPSPYHHGSTANSATFTEPNIYKINIPIRVSQVDYTVSARIVGVPMLSTSKLTLTSGPVVVEKSTVTCLDTVPALALGKCTVIVVNVKCVLLRSMFCFLLNIIILVYTYILYIYKLKYFTILYSLIIDIYIIGTCAHLHCAIWIYLNERQIWLCKPYNELYQQASECQNAVIDSYLSFL
jgi:hypothetical protein